MAMHWKKLLLLPLAAAMLLTGCSEPPDDAARKPEVVAQMVQNSLDVCQRPANDPTGAQYAERLRDVLNDVYTTKLETLQAQGITVCLDQNFAHQNTGLWDRPMSAVFHHTAKPGAPGGVLAVFDPGIQPQDASFWTGNGDSYNFRARLVSQFADKVAAGQVTSHSGNWFGYAYRSGGKYRSTHIYWHGSAEMNQETLAKNPHLLQPPVKTPAPVPRS